MNHLNLLKMTAMMSKTKTVMMAMVITRFVAILEAPHISIRQFFNGEAERTSYLRAMPFRLFRLRST